MLFKCPQLFFDFLVNLYVFITTPLISFNILTATSSSVTVKRVATTRWSCRAEATKALTQYYHRIKDALDLASADVEEKACIHCEVEGLFSQLNKLEMGIYVSFGNKIPQGLMPTRRQARLEYKCCTAEWLDKFRFVKA